MKEITYLLGAGASAGTKEIPGLPLVTNLFAEMEKMAEKIEAFSPESTNLNRSYEKSAMRRFVRDLKTEVSFARDHGTIDTYARKLFLTDSKYNLITLKKVLASYFILAQADILDLRYDSFCATIFEKKENHIELPKNIKIFTWNYDFQFEKAAFRYWAENTGNFLKSLQAIPYPEDSFPGQGYIFDDNKFGFVHLNGVAGVLENPPGSYHREINYIKNDNFEEYFANGIGLYSTSDSNYNQLVLHFAWEPENSHIINIANSIMEKTNVLVVIGYSFPPFNRYTDKKLLSAASHLEKIYLQAPSKDLPGIKNRIKALLGEKEIYIEEINSIDQFHIPYEYI